MDTLPAPGEDAAPTAPGSPSAFEARRTLYEGLIGKAIAGTWQLESLVDFGSMGAVFAARHKSDALSSYAVKILDPDLSAKDRRYVQRFIREARILKTIDHPNVVKVFEYGQYQDAGAGDPLHYYVMELIGGVGGPPLTLHRYSQTRELRIEEVVYVVSQILAGLLHVHQQGVIHRDLKPWNVLIDAQGRCKIVDFGLAKIPDSNLTDVDELFGSKDYIAPELFYRGVKEATPAADLYAVGRIFADLVDRVDFKDQKAGVFASKAAALKYLGQLLARLRQEDPALRFKSAEEVLSVLEDFASSTKIRTTVSPAIRLARAARIRSEGFRRHASMLGRWLLDYGVFIAGVFLLPFVTARNPLVGALLAGSLVTSKLWSALSHPPGRHPVSIVVKALAARMNRILKDGDFRVQYFTRRALFRRPQAPLRARYVSEGHRRQYRAQSFPDGVGPIGLACKMRAAVILYSLPRWGTLAYRELLEDHLKVPEGTWQLLDPTRRGYFCIPLFRLLPGTPQAQLVVEGVLVVDSRLPGAFLKSDVQRAVREYAAVIQDVLEPVHAAVVREMAALGAAPLETILINGQDPKIPPIEMAITFSAGPARSAPGRR